MDRQNVRTRSYCAESNPDFRFPLNALPAPGLMSYPLSYGAYGLLPTGQHAIRRFSLCMVQKPYCPAIFFMTRQGLLPMLKLRTMQLVKTLLIPWKKSAI